MLKTACINPEIMSTLARCGHGDKILITDGNYPIDSNTNHNAKKVYMNLTHGIPTATPGFGSDVKDSSRRKSGGNDSR